MLTPFRSIARAAVALAVTAAVVDAVPASASPPPSGPARSVTADAGAPGAGVAADADGTGLHWLLVPPQHGLVVDVVDRTGVAWPVRAASRDWSTPHVRYVRVTSCRAGVPCVVVGEGSYGRTGWVGSTTATAGQMDTFAGPVRIRLNDSYALTATQRRAVACHELGHALGLDHSRRADSCLQAVPEAPLPDALDLAHVDRLYALRS